MLKTQIFASPILNVLEREELCLYYSSVHSGDKTSVYHVSQCVRCIMVQKGEILIFPKCHCIICNAVFIAIFDWEIVLYTRKQSLHFPLHLLLKQSPY